jgi:hypothetical protein
MATPASREVHPPPQLRMVPRPRIEARRVRAEKASDPSGREERERTPFKKSEE